MNKVAYLKMIQAVIQRLANSSLVIRGWAITLTAGIFALAAKDAEKRFIFVAYFPVLIFWFLDGFYLGSERAFRDLYNTARQTAEEQITFDMTINVDFWRWIEGCARPTLAVFYCTLLLSVVIVMVAVLLH